MRAPHRRRPSLRRWLNEDASSQRSAQRFLLSALWGVVKVGAAMARTLSFAIVLFGRACFSRCRGMGFAAVLLTVIVFLARPCEAHTTGLSTSELDLSTNGAKAELIFAGA